MKNVLIILSALQFLACMGTCYASEPTEPFIRMAWQRSVYVLNDDASHVETHSYAMTVLKEEAIKDAKQSQISYSTSIQKVEILEAYTKKPNGKRTDAPKTNYQVQANSGREKDGPVFSDMSTLTVVFPEVAVGDTVVLTYRIKQLEPIFPGHFSILQQFPTNFAYDEVSIKVDAPSKLWTQYQARKMKEKITTDNNGRKLIEWTYQNKKPVFNKRKDWTVYDMEAEPGFAFSTFKNYADIAAAYGARANAKAAVNDRSRTLAAELTKGIANPRDQAKALYEWVATKITYAGNCVGVGAVVPHDIQFVLDNRMGDCKDHATLLQSLLSAKGIKSTQALINASNVFQLPKIPVVATVNHVINYIPSLNLYVDSTSDVAPFGMLPPNVADKPVLLVDGHQDGLKTPSEVVGTNQQQVKTSVKINADGSLTGNVEVSLKGWLAIETGGRFKGMQKEQQPEMIKNVLRQLGHIGSGTIKYAKPIDMQSTYQYSAKLDIKDFVQRPGPGAFSIAPIFASERPILGIIQSGLDPEETAPIQCSSVFSSEEYVYEFPTNMAILSVPDSFKHSNEFLTYVATYELKGRTLTVKRTLEDRSKGSVCAPAISLAYKQFSAKVMPNLKAQVVYK